MNTIRLAAPVQLESFTDGKGVRMVIWNQGCRLHCPGCHNAQTQDELGGREVPLEDVFQVIKDNASHHQGITLSGGDPFLQPRQNKKIADYAHTLGLDVWAYCGKTYHQLMLEPESVALLMSCDVLVDGPFILAEKDLTLPFRGSRNQEIIDIPRSLEFGKKILLRDC